MRFGIVKVYMEKECRKLKFGHSFALENSFKLFQTMVIAVSYTHLDVYKRQ